MAEIACLTIRFSRWRFWFVRQLPWLLFWMPMGLYLRIAEPLVKWAVSSMRIVEDHG